jgi:hypothetical protein
MSKKRIRARVRKSVKFPANVFIVKGGSGDGVIVTSEKRMNEEVEDKLSGGAKCVRIKKYTHIKGNKYNAPKVVHYFNVEVLTDSSRK